MTAPQWPLTLAGGAIITFSLCLLMPLLTTSEAPLLPAHPESIRVVPIPPRAKRIITQAPTGSSSRSNTSAPHTPSTPLIIPSTPKVNGSLPALPGVMSIPLTAPTPPAEPAFSGSGTPGLPAFDQPPRVLTRLDPLYPLGARRTGTEGEVLVRVLVDEQGRVEEAEVVKSEPAGVFDASALRSVREWRFAPAQREGRPVAVIVNIPIRFTLDK